LRELSDNAYMIDGPDNTSGSSFQPMTPSGSREMAKKAQQLFDRGVVSGSGLAKTGTEAALGPVATKFANMSLAPLRKLFKV
jgi:hypothetical protein